MGNLILFDLRRTGVEPLTELKGRLNMCEKLKNKIFAMVAERFGLSRDEVKIEATFDDLGADSLDMTELHLSTEELLELDDIPYDNWSKVKTIRDLINLAETC